jgi:hypothetical protein
MLHILLGCVIKIVEPTPTLPPEQVIINEPPPEKVVIQRTIIINKHKRIVVKKPRKRTGPNRKGHPKLKRPRPKAKKVCPKPNKQKRPNKDLDDCYLPKYKNKRRQHGKH